MRLRRSERMNWIFWEVTAEGPEGPLRVPFIDEAEARRHAAILWADEAYSNIRVSPVGV